MLSSKKYLFLTLALTGTLLGALYLSPSPQGQGLSLLSLDPLIERAFIDHIARYGKTFATKEEVSTRFQLFKSRYLMVQEHNQRPEATFKMALNEGADVES